MNFTCICNGKGTCRSCKIRAGTLEGMSAETQTAYQQLWAGQKPTPPSNLLESQRVVVQPRTKCVHFGEDTGNTVECAGCKQKGSNVRLKIFHCAIHKTCTPTMLLPEIACCLNCKDWQEIKNR